VPAAFDKGLDSGEGALGPTAEEKVPLVVLSQVGNEIKAGLSPVEKQNASRRNQGQQSLCLLPLRSVNTDHGPGYGKTPEDIIGGCHQAPRVMAPSLMLKSTVWIELLPDFLGCRKSVLGAINGNNRHAVPEIGEVPRKEAVGKLHGIRYSFLNAYAIVPRLLTAPKGDPLVAVSIMSRFMSFNVTHNPRP
jgi:hypothetical protein